jgi:basic membrane protein A
LEQARVIRELLKARRGFRKFSQTIIEEEKMNINFGKKLTALVAALALMAGGGLFAGGGKDKAPAEGAGAMKIALLMPGPINDGGWNTMAYNALMAAKAEFDAEVAYTENVKQNDQVQLLRQYAMRGYTVMIGHGFEFGDALMQVGEDFPDKFFLNFGGGVKNGKNVGSIQYAYGQNGALLGVLAGMNKNIKKVGVIGGFEQPTSQQEYYNIERYAKKYNPAVEFVYSYTGDWDDIAKGKEAAIALLNNGCDLIFSDLSGPAAAVAQAVKENNALYIQGTFDGYDLCPDNIIVSSVQDATKATLAGIQLVKDGKFEGNIYGFGLAEGAVYLGKYGSSVTAEMKAEVEKVKQEIIDGKGDLLILLTD